MTKAIRMVLRLEIGRLRRKHHRMRIKFIEDDNTTELEAGFVIRNDINIRYKIQELNKILKTKGKVYPLIKKLYS